MANLFDYLDWRGDLSFEKAEQNEIDGLIFSELSYAPFENIVPSLEEGNALTLAQVSKTFFDKYGDDYELGAVLPKGILMLLKKASQTKRFASVKVWGFVNEICLDIEKQFSAICFSCENKITYVVYRGTDDTIVGWKEDLNMALFTPIPAQREGLKYLNKVARKIKDKLIIAGHSKGGNVAIYSALNATSRAQKRILNVISYDGPGFKAEFIAPYNQDLIVNRIKTFLPTRSVVGRIFEIIGDYEIVESRDDSLQQHNAFSWRIFGSKFIKAEKFEASSDNFHEVLNLWVSKLKPMERRDFVESFYKIATSCNADTLTDILNKKFKLLIAILKSDSNDKKAVVEAISKLVKEKNELERRQKSERKKAKLEAKKEKINAENQLETTEV